MDMRYKKKKRQIVSAALAAVMAMQLCIPSATFAAVPTKKVESDHGIYGITGGGRAYSDPCGCRRKL